MVGVVLIVEVEVKCVKQQMCIMGVDATNGVLVKGGLVTTRGEKRRLERMVLEHATLLAT